MPVNFTTFEPLGSGIANYIAGRNIGRANDKAQKDLVKYQQNQAFANQIGGGLGQGLQTAMQIGLVNPILAKQQLGFDLARAQAFLPIEQQQQLSSQMIRETGMTPAQVTAQGRNAYQSVPQEMQGFVRQQFNLPMEGDLTDEHFQTMGTQLIQQQQMQRETAARIQIAQARHQQDQLGQLDQQIRGGQVTIPQEIQNQLDTLDKSMQRGSEVFTPEQAPLLQQAYQQKRQNILRGIKPNQIQPVVPPASNYEEWAGGRPPRPNFPYVDKGGVTHIYDGKKWSHTSPPKKDEPPKVQLPPWINPANGQEVPGAKEQWMSMNTAVIDGQRMQWNPKSQMMEPIKHEGDKLDPKEIKNQQRYQSWYQKLYVKPDELSEGHTPTPDEIVKRMKEEDDAMAKYGGASAQQSPPASQPSSQPVASQISDLMQKIKAENRQPTPQERELYMRLRAQATGGR